MDTLSAAAYVCPRSQYDCAWKDLLDVYFYEMMEFFYPNISKLIKWSEGFQHLDKELQQLSTEAIVGRRHVDTLVEVTLNEGVKRWILLHVEVQTSYDAGFEQRLWQYFYRLYDRYAKPVMTLVLLADEHASWRPNCYQCFIGPFEVLTLRFMTIKLLDFHPKGEELTGTSNVFGMIVLAHLAALQTRHDVKQRFNQKYQLTRMLYHQGLKREAILNLYKFIDWCITLPDELELKYNQLIEDFEEEQNMRYVTTAERMGYQRGVQQGVQQGIQQGRKEGEGEVLKRVIEHKFGKLTPKYLRKLRVADADQLLELVDKVIQAKTIEEIFTLLE